MFGGGRGPPLGGGCGPPATKGTNPRPDNESFAREPDLKVNPEYKKFEDWALWFCSIRALIHAHGREEILDMSYAPNPMNPKAIKALNCKQQFTYTTLMEWVLVHTSRCFVQWYDGTLDGCQALVDLAIQDRQSPEASLAGRCT